MNSDDFHRRTVMAVMAMLLLLEGAKLVMPQLTDVVVHARGGMQQMFGPRHETVVPSLQTTNVFARGVAGAPGVRIGHLYFDAEAAARAKNRYGYLVVLVCEHESPSDICLSVADALVLVRQQFASEMVEFAERRGKPCVCDVRITINREAREIQSSDIALQEGHSVMVDGNRGLVLF